MLIEPIIINYLKTELNMTDVYAEKPTPLPDSYVTVSLRDRGVTNHIEAVTLEFMSYAPSKYQAALLDEAVREAMDNATVLSKVMSSKCGGGSDSIDTDNKQYSYRSYYNLYL